MPVQSMPYAAIAQPCALAVVPPQRYSAPVAVNPAAGRRGPIISRRTSAAKTIAGAFFVLAMPLYGGRAWAGFGLAGCLLSRSANPRTAATHNRVAAIRGSSNRTVGAPPMKHLHALNPSRLRAAAHRRMAFAALRADSSASVRLSRYQHHMAKARELELPGGAK